MDKAHAKEILRLYRPGITEAGDTLMADALLLAQQDAELGRWFETHCRLYLAMQAKLKEIPVPADLKDKILRAEAERRGRIVPLHRLFVPLAAAAIVLLLGVGMWAFHLRTRGDVFAAGRDRIVRQAQRPYYMNLYSTNLAQIHAYLVATNFPDYQLTKPLASLTGLGCATVEWRNRKVSMVCLRNKSNQDVFLFVMDNTHLRAAPEAGRQEFARVFKLMTASWTEGDKVYILAGPGTEADLKAYLD